MPYRQDEVVQLSREIHQQSLLMVARQSQVLPVKQLAHHLS